MLLRTSYFLFFWLIIGGTFAQTNTQDIYGKVQDKESGEELIGASIIVLSLDPIKGVITDLDGNYKLRDIPVGRLHIQVSYLGYETANYREVLLSSGKTLNLDVKLQEKFNAVEEITITAKKQDNSTLKVSNEMATVSAMSFNAEQSTRYAGSLNDPSRLVLSLPGVRNQGDVQNGISVRGNTPSGILWSLEGLEVQSPNHFARDGAQGAVNMINSNLIQSVDFYTAAFPAEYGNAGSGVFDLKMRKGNPDRFEFSLSAGTLGMEASAEGPLSKKSKASFLFSYRYSTLNLLNVIGYNIGGNSSPGFQDFNYKLHLPTNKLGTFQVFGLVGDSKIRPVDTFKEGDWSDEYRLSVIGVKNTKRVSDKTLLNTALLYSHSKGAFYNSYTKDRFREDDFGSSFFIGTRETIESFPIIEKRLQLDLKTSTKVSTKHSFQTGINATYINFKQEFKNSRNIYNYNAKQDELIYSRNRTDSSFAKVNTLQIKAFMQHKLRITEDLSITTGLHFIHLNANQFYSVEPRIGLDFSYGLGHKFNIGAGMHSRLEPLGYYHSNGPFYQAYEDPINGTSFTQGFGKPNERLQATKSFHFVAGSVHKIVPKLIFKVEAYFQYLYDIPVREVDYYDWAYSSINFQYPSVYSYNFEYQDVYVNEGKGMNYGVDLSLEKSFARNYYILVNGSYYQSKYKTPTSEKVYEVNWLNTRYNGNFIFTTTIGKDFIIGKDKNNKFGLNIRSIWAGNNRSYYPGEEETFVRPFENRLSNYFRLDTRISYTRNKLKYAWTLSLDLQNTTNRINETSNPQVNTTGIIPFLNYKVDFGFDSKIKTTEAF